MADLIGTRLDQYQIVEQIGVGGMATVYKAYQPSINRYVAIKVLPGQLAHDPNFVKRFEQEVKAIAALEHPHILPVYDFGIKDDLYYMVMRFVPEGTLANAMSRRLSYERICRIVGDVARALDYAHQQGVVHRDIKPSNILIDKNGEALLTDFGIAKMMAGSDGGTQLTGTGSILGTPAYMAPEQARGSSVDQRTDIYALGVVLYELLTGRPPYVADTALAVVLMHINDPLPPPRSLNPGVPEALEQVVIKAMAKDPNQRYQRAADMEQALKEAQREVEVDATMAGAVRSAALAQHRTGATSGVAAPVTATPGRSKLMPLLIGGLLVALLFCLVGGGLIFWALRPGPGPAITAVAIQSTPPPATAAPAASLTPTEPAAAPTTAAATGSQDTLNAAGPAAGVLFADNFESDRYCWSDQGSHLYGNYKSSLVDGRFRLDFQAKQDATLWNTLPGADFGDFVASVEAAPVTSTQPPTGYGLIFRVTPEGDYYLFHLLGPDSFAVYLVRHDQARWQTLAGPTTTPVLKSDGLNRLAVQAVGPALTFFINDQQVAAVTDNSLADGSIGVLVEVAEGRESAVDFDNLLVRQPEGAAPVAAGQILLAECFNSDANGWTTGSFSDADFESKTTIDGRYQVSVTARQKDGYVYRDSLTAQDFSDFVVSVEATPADDQPGYSFGLVFRNAGQTFYTFEVDNEGQYGVYLYDGDWQTLAEGSSQAILPGQTNQLKVITRGSKLAFFINGDPTTGLEDSTVTRGRVGLVTTALHPDQPATVSFDNLIVSQVGDQALAALAALTNHPDSAASLPFNETFDSDANGWATGEFEDDYSRTEVSLAEGRYTIAVSPKKPAYVEKVLPNRQFADFTLSVEATPADSEQHYSYGLAFREDADLHTYVFEIGNDNLYSVQIYDGEWKKLKDWSGSTAIKTGQTNQLQVVAKGSSLTFLVNGESLTSLQDSSLAKGKVGLVVDVFDNSKSATVYFDNLSVEPIAGP